MTNKDVNFDPKLGIEEGDPAEFLLSNSKYHDCYLTVGNPETDQVEKIGVATLDLISHSSVFRDMLADSKLADPTGSNTHITDVSPATFKLMLRHVYGGKLPKMTPEEAAELILCADKYNIQRLVGKAAKRLKPTSAENVFPALMCVVYIKCPNLELQVTEIIQKETAKVVKNPKFLEIDENHILFIVKQDRLNMSELELWNSLIVWAKSQVQKHPQKTLRGCLHKALPYVRLLLLSLEEITKHVLRTKVLTPEEFMDLTLAVTNKQTIQSPGICNSQQKRLIYKEIQKDKKPSTVAEPSTVMNFNKQYVFKPETVANAKLNENEGKVYSTLTIEPFKSIEIVTFMFKSLNIKHNNDSFKATDITCHITIYTTLNGLLTNCETISLCGKTVPNTLITLPVKKSNGQPLILEAGKQYTLQVTTSPALPVHVLQRNVYDYAKNAYIICDCTTNQCSDGNRMKVMFKDPFHIREIAYKVQE